MEILFLSPFLPYPLDQGGKIRIYNIIKHLSTSHRITLVAITDDRHAVDIGPVEELCEEVVMVERPARLWQDRYAFLSGTAPYNVIRYRSKDLERAIQGLLLRKKFDLVQIEFSMMWQYAKMFQGIPVVLDAHNIEHQNVQQIGRAKGSLLWRVMYQLEERRLRYAEIRAFKEAALCFAVSEQERKQIQRNCGSGAKVIAAVNGVDPARFSFRLRENCQKSILFLGGMDYFPNLDAAHYFLTEVFPLVREKEPAAKVLLVGRELGRLGEALQLPGVEAHESVPEVLPWFYAADVLVVPLRQGAGTRIKVLEAMAAGLPVVTTSKGCEGIAVENAKEVIIADTPQALADSLVKVMTEPEVGRSLAEEARHLVAERYTWEATARIVGTSYKRVMGV